MDYLFLCVFFKLSVYESFKSVLQNKVKFPSFHLNSFSNNNNNNNNKGVKIVIRTWIINQYALIVV